MITVTSQRPFSTVDKGRWVVPDSGTQIELYQNSLSPDRGRSGYEIRLQGYRIVEKQTNQIVQPRKANKQQTKLNSTIGKFSFQLQLNDTSTTFKSTKCLRKLVMVRGRHYNFHRAIFHYDEFDGKKWK